jgi:hypothetical protein
LKGEKEAMKKIAIATLCMLSLFAIAFVGNAAAGNPNYNYTCYLSSTEPVIDGQYAYDAEWAASLVQPFGDNGFFRAEWTTGTTDKAYLIIETADATNDAGDYWDICFDPLKNGGASAENDDFRVTIGGHGGAATETWYRGTHFFWGPAIEVGPPAAVFTQAQSLSSTPTISTAHYVLEFFVDKDTEWEGGKIIEGEGWAIYVAYYDATTEELQSWPPVNAIGGYTTTPDSPDTWCGVTSSLVPNPNPDVPENVGIIVALIVSSVAVGGAVFLRKWTKWRKPITALNP